jgi:hypothetical protein
MQTITTEHGHTWPRCARLLPMGERKKAGRHLGLALSPEVSGQLDDLIRVEQERVGDVAVVSASAVVVSLIVAAHRARFPAKAKRPG